MFVAGETSVKKPRNLVKKYPPYTTHTSAVRQEIQTGEIQFRTFLYTYEYSSLLSFNAMIVSIT